MATDKQTNANRQNAKKSTGSRAGEGKARSSQNSLKHGLLDNQAAPDEALREQVGEEGFSDIGKGQEGFVQGVERLAKMPVTERVTITGDITSGLQAAAVSEAPTLTSTFGRVRVNFVTRAVETSPENRFSDGYFFVRMVAAGGPFDASAVGGPSAFSPLNDVATDRSRFNEGTS